MIGTGSCPSSTCAAVCHACDLPGEANPHGLCLACGNLVAVELQSLLESVGPLSAVGRSQAEETRRSLCVLYVSTFTGPQPARIANYLGVSGAATRQYAMRFRAAGIWAHGAVEGPWRSKAWLSPAFCRLLLMDALVGAGLAVRGKGGWEFIEDGGPTKKAA